MFKMKLKELLDGKFEMFTVVTRAKVEVVKFGDSPGNTLWYLRVPEVNNFEMQVNPEHEVEVERGIAMIKCSYCSALMLQVLIMAPLYPEVRKADELREQLVRMWATMRQLRLENLINDDGTEIDELIHETDKLLDQSAEQD